MTRVFARACAKGENGGVSKVAGLHSEWWHKFIVCGPCAGARGGEGKLLATIVSRYCAFETECRINSWTDALFLFFSFFPPLLQPDLSFYPEGKEGGREGEREEGRKERTCKGCRSI